MLTEIKTVFQGLTNRWNMAEKNSDLEKNVSVNSKNE
jgi:hypothetical protein